MRRDAQEVLDLVDALARGLDRIRAYQAHAAGLRLPMFSLLTVVRSAGNQGTTVSDAAYRLGVRPQALSGLVSELCDAELLERVKDPTDGRARRLIITPAGAERLEMGSEIRDRLIGEVLLQVPSPNVARLILGKIEAALRHTLG
jgi:DNA-binding MarR family transcriptional regulator